MSFEYFHSFKLRWNVLLRSAPVRLAVRSAIAKAILELGNNKLAIKCVA